MAATKETNMRTVTPLEAVQETQEKILEQLAVMAQAQADQAEALKLLTERVTTGKMPSAVTVRGTARVCSRGHAMQVSDDYCQHCWREDHPNVQAGRFRPPRANKVEVIPLGDPPTVELDELEPPPPPKTAA